MQIVKAMCVGIMGLAAIGCMAQAPEAEARNAAELQTPAGACIPTTADPQFVCRVARARDPGQHRLVSTVYESFGINAGSNADPVQVTHSKAGWVRFGIDNGDKNPLDHLATYGARVRDYHRQGLKVLFNVTEGLVKIPDRVGGVGGDYAADSCSSDPALHGLWPTCGMTEQETKDLENRWGITSKLNPSPDPQNDYMKRFESALSSLVMGIGGGDDDARPDVWEILNEPDNRSGSASHPNGSQLNVHVMAAILQASRRVVDAANAQLHPSGPKERLAFGALMTTVSWRTTKASAILASPDPEHPVPLFDLATFHVYVNPSEANGVEAGVSDMTGAALGKPLMMTEFGFNVPVAATESDAGAQAIRTLMENAHAMKSRYPLEASFIWSWTDGDSGKPDQYGLASRAGIPCEGGAPKAKASMLVFAEVAESVAKIGEADTRCDSL